MSDSELLERLAAEELLNEAKRGAARASLSGPSGWQKCPLPKTNKKFLNNTLLHTLSSNLRNNVKTADIRSRVDNRSNVRSDNSGEELSGQACLPADREKIVPKREHDNSHMAINKNLPPSLVKSKQISVSGHKRAKQCRYDQRSSPSKPYKRNKSETNVD